MYSLFILLLMNLVKISIYIPINQYAENFTLSTENAVCS